MSGLAKPVEKMIQVTGITSAIITFIVDQATKAAVLANAAKLSAGVVVTPGFNLIYLRNDGVAFGLFGGASSWLLIAVAIAICVLLFVFLHKTAKLIEALSYGTIIGGAAGNIADRIQHGAVTDFLDFYVGSTHWPAFNLADVFIVGGVGLLLFATWREERPPDD